MEETDEDLRKLAKRISLISEAHNEVLRLSLKKEKNGGKITAPRMVRALEEALAGFEELVAELERQGVDGLRPDDNPELDFEVEFLRHERRILRNSSLSKESVNVLVGRIRKARRESKGDLPQASIAEIKSAQAEIKASLDELQTAVANLQNKKNVQGRWGRITKLVGGTVIMGLDSLILATNPVIGGTSIGIAGVIIAERRLRD